MRSGRMTSSEAAVDHVQQLKPPALVAGDGGIDKSISVISVAAYSASSTSSLPLSSMAQVVSGLVVLLPDLEQAAEKPMSSFARLVRAAQDGSQRGNVLKHSVVPPPFGYQK